MNNVMTEPPSLCGGGRRATLPSEVRFNQGSVTIGGEVLFSRYVLPCAFDKLQCGEISENQWRQLLDFAFTETSFDPILCRIFMSKHFSSPVLNAYNYGRICGRNTHDEVWSTENISGSWHEHKGHADECSVKRLVIVSAPVGRLASMITGKECSVLSGLIGHKLVYPLFDLYNLMPRQHRIVYAHKSVIAEISKDNR